MKLNRPQTAWIQSRWWYAVPAFICIALTALLLRGFGTMYWGPLDSDLTHVFYPWQVFINRWIMRGVVPFWDPHVFSGYPTIETQQMLALNPPHLLSLLLPPTFGLIFMMAAQTVIACASMCWALRKWGGTSAMAAALGGALYVCGALFAVRVMAGHITVVAAMAWWPPAAISVLRIARQCTRAKRPALKSINADLLHQLKAAFAIFTQSKRMRRLIIASAACHAMVILAGGPQYVAYLFYIDLTILLAVFRRGRGLTALTLTALVWIIALLVSAPQWLTAFWYLPYTGRATAGGAGGTFSLQPLLNLWLEGIMPFPFGDDIAHGHLHFKNVWETATYPGAIALVFTLAVLFRWCRDVLRKFSLPRPGPFSATRGSALTPTATAGLLLLVLGVYMMHGGWLPGFSGFREATKARAVLAFAIPMISAAGLDAIIRRPHRWRWPMATAAVVGLFMLALASRYTQKDAFIALINTFGAPMDPQAKPWYNFVMDDPAPAQMQLTIAIAIASIGLIVALLTAPFLRSHPRITVIVLFIAAIADPFLVHARAWVSRHEFARANIPPEIQDFFQPKIEASANARELPWRVILHSAIINRTHHLDGFYEYYGYDPLMPAYAVGHMLVPGVSSLQKEGGATWRVPLLERTGVRYDASAWLPPDNQTTAPAVIEAPRARLFDISRNVVAGSPGPNTFGPDLEGRHYIAPRGGTAKNIGQQPIPDDFRKKITRTFPPVDSVSTSSMQLAPGDSIAPLPTGRPDEWGVNVSLTSPALLVFKSNWLPGWRVILDRKDAAPALIANNWMCATIVPAGQHEVVFQYRPVAWNLSWIISIAGVLLCAFIWFYPARSRAQK